MDWTANWNVFIFAGQSNAEGVYSPLPNQSTFEDIQNFGVDYRWHTALEPCSNQGDESYVVDFVNYNEMGGYGATKRFGIELRARIPGAKVGMVNVARGGTSITAWQKTSGLSDETLYGAMVKRVRAASTLGQVRALVWIQGEGDTIPANAATAQIYDQYLAALVSNLRADLGLPNLPVIIAGLGNNTHADMADYPNWSLVRSKQIAAAAAIQNSVYVNMSDVTLTYNLVHYNVPGYNTLAARMAQAYYDQFYGQ